MTLFDVITTVNKEFPNADGVDICHMVNELQSKITSEIFSPHGIITPYESLNYKTDVNTRLLLDNEYRSIYFYYIYSLLYLKELDFENANSYSVLFNQSFEELAISFRRKYKPIKNTPLKGGI